MIQQGFHIGDKDWYIMCLYNISTQDDLLRVEGTLLASGSSQQMTDEAVQVLSDVNHGYTYTSFDNKLTLVFISHATDAEQMYDTIQHELKHVVEHISEYYKISPFSEKSAYLQGEIARQMYPAAAMVICPKCSIQKAEKKWSHTQTY